MDLIVENSQIDFNLLESDLQANLQSNPAQEIFLSLNPAARVSEDFDYRAWIDYFITVNKKEINYDVLSKINDLITKENLSRAINLKYTSQLMIYQGDITTLKVDCIVNAANETMLGCFTPEHHCIDNAIHLGAGPSLRLWIKQMIGNKTFKSTDCIITPGFCLPAKSIIHAIGPIYPTEGSNNDKTLAESVLAETYKNILNLAANNNVKTLAICCISTGVFGFPNGIAADIATRTVNIWLMSHDYHFDCIIFNTFLDKDTKIYQRLI